MSLWKQVGWGLVTGLLISGFMFLMIFVGGKPKLDAHGQVIVPPPPQYPYVDQSAMTLTLKADERFVSYQRVGVNGEYFRLTTKVIPSSPTDKPTYRVYSGLMEGSGTMISQPNLSYIIKEQ